MAKRLIPTFNRILVEKIVPPSKTSAGILLPEKTSQVSLKAELSLLHCFELIFDF
jgi:co-chaperonin GroES (HSP10)